jgi:hypothetical protein
MKPFKHLKIVTAILLNFYLILPANGQARIGKSKESLTDEFQEYKPKFDISTDGKPYMHFEMKYSIVFHYFNEDEICTMSVILPKEEGMLNYLVELYNKSYVIVDDRNWKMYAENGAIATIQLVSENETSFFVWQ